MTGSPDEDLVLIIQSEISYLPEGGGDGDEEEKRLVTHGEEQRELAVSLLVTRMEKDIGIHPLHPRDLRLFSSLILGRAFVEIKLLRFFSILSSTTP